jgi:CO/xanthine dehydrogenase Mo-binding subunit
MNGGPIGRSLRRLEDRRFLVGQGRYVDDGARAQAAVTYRLRGSCDWGRHRRSAHFAASKAASAASTHALATPSFALITTDCLFSCAGLAVA